MSIGTGEPVAASKNEAKVCSPPGFTLSTRPAATPCPVALAVKMPGEIAATLILWPRQNPLGLNAVG